MHVFAQRISVIVFTLYADIYKLIRQVVPAAMGPVSKLRLFSPVTLVIYL